MRWGILGPLQVTEDTGAEIALPTGRIRVLLAALLTRPNHAVSIDELGELLWDGAPPPGAARTVRVHVVRLRRALGPSAGTRIVTRAPGYLYQCPVGEDELDLLRFESLCHAGSTAIRAEDWTRAADLLTEASELWRGTPLADVPSESLRGQFVPRVEQLHLQALEGRIEAELQLGRAEQVVPQARDLAAAYPLRERFHAQLIAALAASGRRAEALAAYQQARRVLVDELGIEPGSELRTLHEAILAGEPDPIRPRAAVPREPPTRTAPRQLPTAVRHFTGRQTELDTLTQLLDENDVSNGIVVISAIDGMAGIGKTALAVNAAHRLAEKFPDGQLFLNLHGYTQGYPPRTAGEALTWLLQALGVPPAQIPQDTEQAAALYRQRLAETRTLIVLDNATTESQVRPLLPGTGSCLVLVTSRRRLRALDDAHSISLDLLSPPDAVALLGAVAGPDRIAPDDPLTGQVAELCGRLPLALRIAASLLRHRPTWNLEQLAGELRDQQHRLAALADDERKLTAVFDLSYASLDEHHRHLWRRLGLIPGPDLDTYAAAALTTSDPGSATGLLENLVDHNLLTAYAPGRYRMHDLLRIHARTLAEAEPESAAVLDQLLHYYAHTAQTASIPVGHYPRPAPDGPSPAHTPTLSTPEAARAWLRAERGNLEAAYRRARDLGLHGRALALTEGLAVILCNDGPFARSLTLYREAAATAERLGLPVARAMALTHLGILQRLTGDLTGANAALSFALKIHELLGDRRGQAIALAELSIVRRLTGDPGGADGALTDALEIYRALGHRRGEAHALNDLGIVRLLTGDLAGAAEAQTQALEIFRAIGHRHGEADALSDLGQVHRQSGDLSAAGEALTTALEIYRSIDHRHGQASALTGLGIIYSASGDPGAAEPALSRALDIFRELRHESGEAYALTERGVVRLSIGDAAGAAQAHHKALEFYRAVGHRGNHAEVLNRYAAAIAAGGDLPRAVELYEQALAANRELNKPREQATALEGLGGCHLSHGDPDAAAVRLREALEIYERLGMALDAHRVHDSLSQLTES